MNRSIAIVPVSEAGAPLARTIRKEFPEAGLYSTAGLPDGIRIASLPDFLKEKFACSDALVFIGALGICVREIAPFLRDKYHDPAVVCVDTTGRYVIPVVSGHIGGANDLARQIAAAVGGEAVITTQSDNAGLWPLDTLSKRWGWKPVCSNLNDAIFRFVGRKPTALLLEIKDGGTAYLERTCPPHVDIYYRWEDIRAEKYELIITVTPFVHETDKALLQFCPAVLHLGVGCRKNCRPEGISGYIKETVKRHGLEPAAIRSISTIELKKDEPLLPALQAGLPDAHTYIYSAAELETVEIPNPSRKVFETTGVYGVAEAAARKSAGNGPLAIEKQKGCLSDGNDFTFALAIEASACRKGHIEIVGAGPGDPELISVRGKRFLEEADLILYAGSLVPKELTEYARKEAVVKSSASLTLEEQFDLMKTFYDKGSLVVRLHTGDPCIYGAIQEQMAFFDRHGMSYHITPGISSFQAAAAALQSQFTIPEKVQTIILTRGEGRTPMPEKEKLHLLAQSQSTMCIFLSAGVAEQVQEELLQHYPPATPVAVCYRLTWKDERIYRGELKDLARIVNENHLTLTTMIVVGDAIDNREGLSRLYSHEFKHLFRR
ncbi:MAG: precorrin-4 C(11)-methyltransferase [Parabacteroides sp.]|nr:precorrin-4 C(11)-methyltransferase [Parabacteroides sp.]